MNTKPTVKVELTPEQKERIRRLTGKQLGAMKLSLMALEQRLAPVSTQN